MGQVFRAKDTTLGREVSGVETRVGYPLADVASNGTVLYLPSQPATARLVWVSRTGIETPINDIPRNYVGPRVSPDGRLVAVYVDDNTDSGGGRISIGKRSREC